MHFSRLSVFHLVAQRVKTTRGLKIRSYHIIRYFNFKIIDIQCHIYHNRTFGHYFGCLERIKKATTKLDLL